MGPEESMNITLPHDLESCLADEAKRRGTTPELLAVHGLRQLFTPRGTEGNTAATLFEFLGNHVGAVAGASEALSEDCGRRFAEGLVAKQQSLKP